MQNRRGPRKTEAPAVHAVANYSQIPGITSAWTRQNLLRAGSSRGWNNQGFFFYPVLIQSIYPAAIFWKGIKTSLKKQNKQTTSPLINRSYFPALSSPLFIDFRAAWGKEILGAPSIKKIEIL